MTFCVLKNTLWVRNALVVKFYIPFVWFFSYLKLLNEEQKEAVKDGKTCKKNGNGVPRKRKGTKPSSVRILYLMKMLQN